MKNLFTKSIMAGAIILLSLTILHAQNVQKNDIILKLTGDELVGRVIEINDADIKFAYAGESLQYTIKKSEVSKITFASGRIEFFNRNSSGNSSGAGQPATSAISSGLADHHNKVAILPFHFLIDKRDAGGDITYQVQSEVYNFLDKHNAGLTLQDPNTTNALLIKAGITSNTERGYTMGEICNVLGVEIVVHGTVFVNQGNTSTIANSANTYSNSNQNNKPYVDRYGNVVGSIYGNNNKGRSSSSTVATTIQNYKSSVTMYITNDHGMSLFNQSHDSFWTTDNAYHTTLEYLLKKTPIYRK